MASRRFQPWRSLFPVRTDADRVHFATTHDGWRLALSRYQPSRATRNFPVVLCHGLAASYIGFDLDPEVSLARRLRSLGYDVWAIELRGHGLSDLPSLFGKQRYAWTFDDYLERDAPCILDFIRAETGIDGVHWIGHSMGGILLYALIATGCKAIRSGVTVASGLDYSVAENDFAKIAPLRKYVRFLPALPLGLVASTMAPLSGRFRNAIERFNTWPSNVEPHLVRRLNANLFHAPPMSLLMQLASVLEPGGLRSVDDRIRYLDGLQGKDVPVLALAGTRDRQCPPKIAKVPVDALGPSGKLAVFGREHGHHDDYGHFDLLIGKNAAQEVLPSVFTWLDEHDASTPAKVA